MVFFMMRTISLRSRVLTCWSPSPGSLPPTPSAPSPTSDEHHQEAGEAPKDGPSWTGRTAPMESRELLWLSCPLAAFQTWCSVLSPKALGGAWSRCLKLGAPGGRSGQVCSLLPSWFHLAPAALWIPRSHPTQRDGDSASGRCLAASRVCVGGGHEPCVLG